MTYANDDRMRIYRLNQLEFRQWRDHASRAELTRQIFAQHGVAQVRAPSGRILGTARQSDERVPIERSKVRPAHHVVRPGECMCREWQKPAGNEHEHHPICINKAAWEAQQRFDPDTPRDRVVVSPTVAHQPVARAEPAPAGPLAPQVPVPRGNAPESAAAQQDSSQEAPDTEPAPPPSAPAELVVPPAPKLPEIPAVPAPNGCVCQKWAGVAEGNHHTLCQFRSAWERERKMPVPQLVELETGEVVREASVEEAAASKQNEGKDGVGAIEGSDGKLYYVRTG